MPTVERDHRSSQWGSATGEERGLAWDGMSVIRTRFQTLQAAPVLASKNSIARGRGRRQAVQAMLFVLWDPRSGHALLSLLLEDEHVR